MARSQSHLRHGEDSLSTGYHFVPLVVQHVHVAVGFVATDEFRNVGRERRVLGQADSITCR